jgi:hypothetical protein
MTCGWPVAELIAFRTLLRSIQPSTFSSLIFRHFDSTEQAKSRQYRATSSVKRCFDWKNGPIAHSNNREERKIPTDGCILKDPESEIGVGGLE